MIKNLIPSLPEVGKIKIGFKGGEITSKQGKKFQPPKKLDHFIVTGLERGTDGNFVKNAEIHQQIGEKPVEIDVRLLYDDPNLNFLTRYACYSGTKLWCTGDGETASRLTGENGNRTQVKCPCEHLDAGYKAGPKCKPSGVLSVMLDNSPIVGGVHKLRTTSFNSVTNILSSMAMISRITGGVLAGIPLKLTFGKKTTTVPGTEQQTTIPIIGLVYKGSVKELAESGQRTALEFAGYRKRIEYIEDIARKQLDKEMGLGIYTEGETDEDIAAEFYPEQVTAGAPEVQEKKSDALKTFEDIINEGVTDSNLLPYVEKYAKASSEAAGCTIEQIKQAAIETPTRFIVAFKNWVLKQGETGKKKMPAPETKTATAPETATKKPEPEKWDPYKSEVQMRYPSDKAEIIKAECEARGIMIKGLVPREAHALLLDAHKADLEDAANGNLEDHPAQSTTRWKPLDHPVQELYSSEEMEIIKLECEKRGHSVIQMKPGEAHALLLKEVETECDPETDQAKAHAKLLADREAKRKAAMGEEPPPIGENKKPVQTDWDENAPQRIAGEAETEEQAKVRLVCIDGLVKIAGSNRPVWLKAKQQAGVGQQMKYADAPLDKLIEWHTLAKAMMENAGMQF